MVPGEERAEEADGSEDSRRVYYDHEPAYKVIAESGGSGWDDLPAEQRGVDLDEIDNDSYVALQRFLASRFAPPAGTRTLELGCGGGQAAIVLAEHGYNAVGVDFSETAIDLARANADNAGLAVEFVVGDVLDHDDLDDDTFGLIVDNHCWHCLVEPDDRLAFLSEAARLLEAGGVLFSETMTREGDFDGELLNVDPDTHISAAHTRYFASKIEIDEALSQAGFNVVQTYTHHQEPGAGLTLVNYALAR